MREPQRKIHSTSDKEDEVDKADDMVEEAEQVVVEDKTNALHLPAICAIKHKEEVDEADGATMVVSRLHQEVREQ